MRISMVLVLLGMVTLLTNIEAQSEVYFSSDLITGFLAVAGFAMLVGPTVQLSFCDAACARRKQELRNSILNYVCEFRYQRDPGECEVPTDEIETYRSECRQCVSNLDVESCDTLDFCRWDAEGGVCENKDEHCGSR